MSLLIDALRKAEQERERSDAPVGGPEALALEPMSPPPDLTRDELPDRAQREAAANLFAVKAPSPSHNRLTWFALAGVLAGVALAAYVWWQMQPSALVARQPPRPLPAPQAATEAPQEVVPAQAADAPAGPRPATAPDMADAPPEPAALAGTAASTMADPRPRPAPPRTERGSLGRIALAPAAAEVPEAPPTPRLRRSSPPPAQVPALLAQAYADYSAGRIDAAHDAYRMHLQSDPNSVDALNGLGAIALERGQPQSAAIWFRRALAASPQDPVAQAGLASALPSGPAGDESQLRALLAQSPDSPAAAFALGNALAAQRRWAEAQQAYFQAYTGEPDNPDFLVNLAVSLDQLGQPALARDFYRRALQAAQTRPAVFDPAPVRVRLAALEESTR
jgi:tetratricopeptide (TPR) repeat protein